MADIDDYRALLTRTKVSFDEKVTEGRRKLVIEAGDGNPGSVNEGYVSFYAELVFDESGALCKFGVWE
jgi:hypothetical protein